MAEPAQLRQQRTGLACETLLAIYRHWGHDNLRQDVTFHDGTPFDATAVKASFDHIVSDAVLESGGKTLLVDHQYTETEVVDDYTAVVKFAAPYPTFLRDAARQWLSISSPAALAQYGKDYAATP